VQLAVVGPVTTPKVPSGHEQFRKDVAWATVVTDGLGHGTGRTAPALQKLFWGQVVCAALELQKKPAAQVVGVEELTGQKAPGGHPVGAVELTGHEEPAGHGSWMVVSGQ
jgi:hypothetical protein